MEICKNNNQFRMPSHTIRKTKKTDDKPVSVDLQRVQKRQVSSFVHGPIAASFALGPEREKKLHVFHEMKTEHTSNFRT